MEPIYLDYAATTPVRAEVRAAMEPFLGERFGNPSSLHRWGQAAAIALGESRARIAEALRVRPSEIRFVRGGTESDNLAILGTAKALAESGRPVHIAVSSIEHHAVLEAAEYAEQSGDVALTRMAVTPDGSMSLECFDRDGATPDLASAMWVNNETGIVLPVPELTERAKACGAVVHSDASQAVGKVPVDLTEVPLDLLTFTGHKIYGPGGAGALFVREGTRLSPLLHGGGQERALRPGTEDVAGAVGLAEAVVLAVAELEERGARLAELRATLETGISQSVEGVRVNGGDAPRSPHVSSLAFEGVSDGPGLVMAMDLEGVAVSGGSACASGSTASSHVIGALYGENDGRATVRFSFGDGTTAEQVDHAVRATVRVVERMRAAP